MATSPARMETGPERLTLLVGSGDRECDMLVIFLIFILTRHEEAEPGDRLQGLVVVVRPALDQRALTHNVSSDVRETRTDLVTPADVSHLQIIDGLAVHLK